MILIRSTICAAVLVPAIACALHAAEPQIRVFNYPPGALSAAKALVEAKDSAVKLALEKLVADADKALSLTPPTVMDKPQLPPSGDRHDYMSQAPYFWPDPTKKDGLPYIRKDGQRNPESHDAHSDAPRMASMANAAETLALACYLTGKEACGEHAAAILRTWFLDEKTRMNPNFNFAQAVPGINTGRGTGMIESRSIIPAMNAAALLIGSAHWSAADEQGFESWMHAFLGWAQTSPNGKSEAAARNNHGSFYDEQIVALALFLGENDLARRTLESVKTKRIAVQIKPDGSQPLELERADSFGYSRFNLVALCSLATEAEHLGIDLWSYTTEDGAGIHRALDFLLPYVEDPEKEWPYAHGNKEARNLNAQLWQAGIVYHEPRYIKAAQTLVGFEKSREALLYPMVFDLTERK